MVDAAGGHCGGGGGPGGKAGGADKALAEDHGGTPEEIGEGESLRAVGGRARPKVFQEHAT